MVNHGQHGIRVTLLILVLIISSIAGREAARYFRAAPATNKAEKQPPDLFVSAQDCHFGEQWESDAFEWTLPVKNLTGEPIRIERFHTSCKCLIANTEGMEIPAGGTAQIRLSLDFRSFDVASRPADGVGFSSTLGRMD